MYLKMEVSPMDRARIYPSVLLEPVQRKKRQQDVIQFLKMNKIFFKE